MLKNEGCAIMGHSRNKWKPQLLSLILTLIGQMPFLESKKKKNSPRAEWELLILDSC